MILWYNTVIKASTAPSNRLGKFGAINRRYL